MKKQLFIISLATMLFIMAFGTASAVSQAFESPAANGRISGTIDVNVSVNTTMYGQGSTLNNVTKVNVNFTRTTPSGGTETNGCSNVTNTLNATATNALMSYQCSLNTAPMEDIGVYTLTASLHNTSGVLLNSTTVTGIMIDNTAPTLSLDQAIATRFGDGDSITAAITNTTVCNIQFGGNSQLNMTRNSAGTSCSYILTYIVPDGSYDTIITVSDGLNSTAITRNYAVSISAGSNPALKKQKAAAQAATQAAAADQSKNSLMMLFVIIAGALVLGKLKLK